MKFGVMYDFRNPEPWRRPFPELYRAMLDQIVRVEDARLRQRLAERASLRRGRIQSLGPDDGRGNRGAHQPDSDRHLRPAAAVSRRGTNRRGQRRRRYLVKRTFRSGIGQGYRAEEFTALCIPREERSARFAEGVELIKRLWTEERVSFAGEFNQIEDMTLSPKPVQKPHPPIWIGARTEKATHRAARLGYHLLATLGPDPAVPYVKALRDCGRNPSDYSIAQARTVYVAKSAEQAWDEAGEHLHYMMRDYASWLGEAMDAPGDERTWLVRNTRELRESRLAQRLMIGTPEDCVAKIERFRQAYACTHLIMATQLPGLDPHNGLRSLELFAKEVMPHFRDRS